MSDDAKPPQRMQPLFLIKPKTISAKDIKRAEQRCGITIVECSDPETARFLEPPIDADIDAQARAALSLFRYIVRGTESPTTVFYGGNLIKWFTNTLIEQPLPPRVPRVRHLKGKT